MILTMHKKGQYPGVRGFILFPTLAPVRIQMAHCAKGERHVFAISWKKHSNNYKSTMTTSMNGSH